MNYKKERSAFMKLTQEHDLRRKKVLIVLKMPHESINISDTVHEIREISPLAKFVVISKIRYPGPKY